MPLLNNAEIDQRVATTQAVVLNIDDVATPRMKRLVKANAEAIGCPFEFILFPLVSIACHFMGPNAKVKIRENWLEPLILWSVVLADKGQKKSPALNRFLKHIKSLEELIQQQEQQPSSQEDDQCSPQIYIEHFSMEELHYTLKRNNGRVLGLYDEISFTNSSTNTKMAIPTARLFSP